MKPIQLTSLTLAIIWMTTIFLLSHQQSLPSPTLFPSQDKLFHVIVYAVLGMLFIGALPHKPAAPPCRTVMIAGLLATLYGCSDEFHQSFIPGRSAEITDILADGVGAFLGASITALLSQRWRAASASI